MLSFFIRMNYKRIHQKSFYCLPVLFYCCRISNRNCVIWNILRNNRSRPNNGVFPNSDPRQYGHTMSYPSKIITDHRHSPISLMVTKDNAGLETRNAQQKTRVDLSPMPCEISKLFHWGAISNQP